MKPDAQKNPQLKAPREQLCTECHNADVPVGEPATAGDRLHHPVKEMTAGYGAIDVAYRPSVHMGRCTECHMVPTGYEYNGAAATAGNHVFKTVTPMGASSQTTVAGGIAKAMPYSACGTCHGTLADPLATYLGGTITTRQQWTSDSISRVSGLLDAAAGRLGFSDVDKARGAVMKVPSRYRTRNQVNLLKGYTNTRIVGSEGSLGIHNWAHTVAIIDKADQQARAVKSDRWVVKRKVSKRRVARRAKVRSYGTVKTSSLIAGRGKVVIQRKVGKRWRNVATALFFAHGHEER